MDAKAPPFAASTLTTLPSLQTSSNLQTSKSGCSSSLCVEPSLELLEFTFVSELDGDAPRSVDEPDLRGPIPSDAIAEAVRINSKSRKKPPTSSGDGDDARPTPRVAIQGTLGHGPARVGHFRIFLILFRGRRRAGHLRVDALLRVVVGAVVGASTTTVVAARLASPVRVRAARVARRVTHSMSDVGPLLGRPVRVAPRRRR